MNVLFLTQSRGLRMFYDLMGVLRESLRLDRVGFYLADYHHYQQFCEEHPDIESGSYCLLKEWEITEKAKHGAPDQLRIRHYEETLGNPTLWGSLVADRRVYLGKHCTFQQDYRPRFTHDEMLRILEEGLVSIERLFEAVQPNAVVSFICVTFGEYLAYLFARSRGIPFLNLRPTRIKNYVTFGDSIFEPSDRIHGAYRRYLASQLEDAWTTEAQEYVALAKTEHAMYEGVIPPTRTPRTRVLSMRVDALVGMLLKECQYRFGEIKDNHNPGVLVPLLYKQFLNPVRAWWNHKRLSARYIAEVSLSSLEYVFFPLHTEPEVSLLVYGKPYLNQIEVIRNISHNIPVGMRLLVKEHPASVGKRPLGYYQKILEIPNVYLVDPSLGSRSLVANARVVATIAGSIGWEAVLRQKPVLILGHTPYEFLPASMVRRVTDLEHLGDEISDLMRNYQYQEEVVVAYVAAVMSQSVPVNLYSALLGRQGVYTAGRDTIGFDEARRKDIELLARYTANLLEGGSKSKIGSQGEPGDYV